MDTAALFITTAFFFGSIIVPVYFLFRLVKWMKNRLEIRKRTNILAINICVMVAYTWLLNTDDLGYFLAWFLIGITHMIFFLFAIEMDLQKEKREKRVTHPK